MWSLQFQLTSVSSHYIRPVDINIVDSIVEGTSLTDPCFGIQGHMLGIEYVLTYMWLAGKLRAVALNVIDRVQTVQSQLTSLLSK